MSDNRDGRAELLTRLANHRAIGVAPEAERVWLADHGELARGLGIAALFALVGLTVVMTGLGLVWATRASTEKAKAPAFKQVANPA
jgi:hypothetical protein